MKKTMGFKTEEEKKTEEATEGNVTVKKDGVICRLLRNPKARKIGKWAVKIGEGLLLAGAGFIVGRKTASKLNANEPVAEETVTDDNENEDEEI